MLREIRAGWAAVVVGWVGLGMGGEVARGQEAAEPAAAPPGWKLVWSDEFAGDAIDRAKWDFDTGTGFYNYENNTWLAGWGNDELQCYTKDPENAFVRDGMLHIKAIKESYNGSGYTSARLKTRKRDGSSLFSKAYGRFEFRAKLPTGKGVWPALWMLPLDDAKYGGWPLSGEIDVMEARGQEPTKVLGTLHYGSKWPGNVHSGEDFAFPKGTTIADFHTYAVEWEPGEIRWYVDATRFATRSSWYSSTQAKPARESDLLPWPAPFDRPFYLVMNVAVGGKFLGNPDAGTAFPAEMVVDHVRVYDKVGGYGPVKPRGPGGVPFAKP